MCRKKRMSFGRRIRVITVALLCMAICSGCGETPFELEENEREIIVNYAAHIVAKYNTKQPEGYTYVYPKEEEAQQEEKTEEKDETADDTQSPSTTTDQPAADAADPAENQTVTLAQALGLEEKNVSAVYTGTEFTDQYQTVVQSTAGQLMIVHVTLKNEGKKKVRINLLDQIPVFRATVNEDTQVTADLTLLDNDLSTLDIRLKPGKSVDAVIVFSMPDKNIQNVDKLTMNVNLGGRKSVVEFL